MKAFLVELWDDLLSQLHLVRLSEAVQVEHDKRIALDRAETLQRELANLQEQFRKPPARGKAKGRKVAKTK